MKFPRGRPLLENARLEFLNLENVLSASKRERAHRISGYISIFYPDTVELIFLKEGEPFNAARISQTERSIVPINEVVEKAKKASSMRYNPIELSEDALINILRRGISINNE